MVKPSRVELSPIEPSSGSEWDCLYLAGTGLTLGTLDSLSGSLRTALALSGIGALPLSPRSPYLESATIHPPFIREAVLRLARPGILGIL